jgi:hypothetical protein
MGSRGNSRRSPITGLSPLPGWVRGVESSLGPIRDIVQGTRQIQMRRVVLRRLLLRVLRVPQGCTTRTGEKCDRDRQESNASHIRDPLETGPHDHPSRVTWNLVLPFPLDPEPEQVAVEDVVADGRDSRLLPDRLQLEPLPDRVGQVDPPLARLLDRGGRLSSAGLGQGDGRRGPCIPPALVSLPGGFLGLDLVVPILGRRLRTRRPDQGRW